MSFINYGILQNIIHVNMEVWVGWDSSVGIATRYGLDGPGIGSRSGGRHFLHPSRQAFGLIQPSIWWVEGKAVPLQAWSGPEGSRKLRFPDFMKTAQDGSKVVSLTHRPPLLPGNAPGIRFCYRLIRPQGHSAIGRMTPAGIEPATFRFVALHLNHYATVVPLYTVGTGSFLGVKWQGQGIDHQPPSSANVKGRVQLFLYSRFGPSWPVLEWNLPLPLPLPLPLWRYDCTEL